MMSLVLLLMILGFMVFWLVYDNMHASTTRQIQNAFDHADYRTAEKLMTGKKASFLFGTFGCRLGRFDLAVAQDQKEKAEKLLSEIESMSLQEQEKATLYAKAFNFYLIHDNQNKCMEYTEKITDVHSRKASGLRHAVTMAYDAIYSHRTDHLEDILDIYAWKSFTGKAFLEYELACIYENINDEENASKYMKLYESHEEDLRLNPGINGVWINQ